MTEENETPAQDAQPQEQKPAPTLAEMVATVRLNQERDFDRRDYARRLKILIRKSTSGKQHNNPLFGYYNPSIEYSLDELKALIPLDEDRLNYSFQPTKEGGTGGVLAENRHGLYAVPASHGRRKPHMTHRQQAVKSAAIRIFRKLIEATGTTLRATCKEQEIEYLGIPDATIPELGQKATRIAVREVTAQRKAYSRNNRRRQEHSRKVNRGLLTVSTSEVNYVNRGGEYGR